jgi:hypothetical protein
VSAIRKPLTRNDEMSIQCFTGGKMPGFQQAGATAGNRFGLLSHCLSALWGCTLASSCLCLLADAACSPVTSVWINAKRMLTDNPHIRTPMMLSMFDSSRHCDGSTTSPYPTVEYVLPEK